MIAFQTCSAPDRGYMGDRRRGASLGRSNRTRDAQIADIRFDIESAESALDYFAKGGIGGAAIQDPAARRRHIADLEARLAADRIRLEKLQSAPDCPRFHLRRVRLDSGGYDRGGAYWGHGGELFEAFSADGVEFMTLRVWPQDRAAAFERRGGVRIGAPGRQEFEARCPHWARDGSREAAKDIVRQIYPDAKFFR